MFDLDRLEQAERALREMSQSAPQPAPIQRAEPARQCPLRAERQGQAA
jgi:hypothetical protein